MSGGGRWGPPPLSLFKASFRPPYDGEIKGRHPGVAGTKPSAASRRRNPMNRLHTRRSAIVATLAGLALALSGCGGSQTPSATTGSDTSLSDVKSKGEIVIATEGTYKPFSFHAEGAGELTGFDVEIAKAVADKLGVKAKFEETQFDGIFAGLDAKRFDTIANQISINAERKRSEEHTSEIQS